MTIQRERGRQLVSKNNDLFDILRGSQTWLSTVELPYLGGTMHDPITYTFESCLFNGDGVGEVLSHYISWEDAIEGHKLLAEKYGLTIHEERVID